MLFLWIAVALVAACYGLFKFALTFTFDASPVGSVILMVSGMTGLGSVFMFGVAAGRLL